MSGDSGGAASRGTAVLFATPGPALAAQVASIDTAQLSDHDLLEFLAATERLVAWTTSVQLNAAADFARRPARIERQGDDVAALRATHAPLGQWVREFADDEFAARLEISRHAASTRIATGCALTRLPRTSAALRQGQVDLARVRVITEEVARSRRTPRARLRPQSSSSRNITLLRGCVLAFAAP